MEVLRYLCLCNKRVFIYLFAIVIFNYFNLDVEAIKRQGRRNDNKGSAGNYGKRSVGELPSTFAIQALTNASFMMCKEAMTIPTARMVHLNDDHMRAYLQDKGGNYVKDYMAATQEEAVENFKNMVILTSPINVDGSEPSFTMNDNIIAKQTVIDDLNKLVAFLKANQTNNTVKTGDGSPGNQHNTKPETPVTDSTTTSEGWNKSLNNANIPASSTSLKTPITTKETSMTSSVHATSSSQGGKWYPKLDTTINPSPFVQHSNNSPPNYKTPTPKTISGTSMTTPPSTDSVGMSPLLLQPSSPSPTPTTTPTSTEDPAVKFGLDQLFHYVQGAESERDLEALWRSANTTLHPSALFGLAMGNGRTKRNADGSYSRVEYCQSKGSLTEDRRYVHLCSKCAATTKLSENMYPRYINEAICKIGDTDCFTVAGTSHGQCKQTKFTLNMLHKKQGHCNMLLHGAETLVFERWELVQQTIRVSCECTLNKLSLFSQYAGPSVPFG